MRNRSDYFWKRVHDYERDEMRDQISHSTSYHSFFQGYSERRVPKQNGKGYRIERIYTADYCKYQETDHLWKFKKVYYLLVLAGAIVSLIAGGTSYSRLNSMKVIGIAQMLEWIPVVYLTYSMIFQLQAPRLMTIGDYRASSAKLKWGALITTIYLFIVFLAMVFGTLFSGNTLERSDVTALFGELAGAGFSFLIFQMEHRREIEWIKNSVQVPDDANEIW